MEYYILVLIHVLCGILWAGSAISAGFFLIPSIQEAGGAAGGVMAGMMKRKYDVFQAVISVLSVLSGLRLYYLRFSMEWLHTSEGKVLTLGGLLALSAWFIGLLRQKPLGLKMAQLAKEGRHAEIPPLAAQAAKYARVAAWHLVAVAVLMASHRLASLF